MYDISGKVGSSPPANHNQRSPCRRPTGALHSLTGCLSCGCGIEAKFVILGPTRPIGRQKMKIRFSPPRLCPGSAWNNARSIYGRSSSVSHPHFATLSRSRLSTLTRPLVTCASVLLRHLEHLVTQRTGSSTKVNTRRAPASNSPYRRNGISAKRFSSGAK
jgi:hypothetical protein